VRLTDVSGDDHERGQPDQRQHDLPAPLPEPEQGRELYQHQRHGKQPVDVTELGREGLDAFLHPVQVDVLHIEIVQGGDATDHGGQGDRLPELRRHPVPLDQEERRRRSHGEEGEDESEGDELG
jgi:hypothetical protein